MVFTRSSLSRKNSQSDELRSSDEGNNNVVNDISSTATSLRNQRSIPKTASANSTNNNENNGNRRKTNSTNKSTTTNSKSKSQRPNKRLKLNSDQSLEQLFDKSYHSQPVDWESIQARIRSHPEEIEPQTLHNALMIYNPTVVPPSIIRDMISKSTKSIYSLPALQFAFTCPWIDLETIEALMDGTKSFYLGGTLFQQIGVEIDHSSDSSDGSDSSNDDDDSDVDDAEDADDAENNANNDTDRQDDSVNRMDQLYANERIETNNTNENMFQAIEQIASATFKQTKLLSICCDLLHKLYESHLSPPPRFDAVKIMLKHFPNVLEKQDPSDRDLPLHSACWNERNAKFIELFVQTLTDFKNSSIANGGLLVVNDFGLSPLKLIVQKWSDLSGAKMIETLISISKISQADIAQSKIVFEAIKQEKLSIVRTIIRLAPQSMKERGSLWRIPLHILCYSISESRHRGDYEMIKFMIEQTLLNQDELKLYCGGLLEKDSNYKTPLQLLSTLGKKSNKEKVFVMGIIKKFLVRMWKNKGVKCKITYYFHETLMIKHLGKFLHEAVRIKDWELVIHILDKYPKSLQYKDSADNLPIHKIAETDAPFDIVKLFIEVGIKQKSGPLKNRAGLYQENKYKERPLDLIVKRTCSSNGRVFKFLQGMKPKLITKKDIKDLNLLHKVAKGGRPSVARALLKCVPSSISLKNKDGNLPIHFACKGKINASNKELIRILLQYGLEQNVGGSTGFGGIYVENKWGCTAMCNALYEARFQHFRGEKWDIIHVIMDLVSDAPLLHNAIKSTYNVLTDSQGKMIEYIIEKFPKCVGVVDSNGQLPLHLALTKDLPKCYIDMIVKAYPIGLDIVDPVSGLMPFALTAKGDSHVSFTYSILRRDPSFFSSKLW